MIHIGIDVGLSGALAVIRPEYTKVFDVPTAEVSVNGKRKRDYLIANMVDLVGGELDSVVRVFAVVEKVSAMPGQGVTSMFSFGRGLGIWEGILSALRVPYTKVSPQTWKKAMLADMPRDNKDSSRIQATRLFPQLSSELSRKKDDGRAEALLMASYAQRLRN